MACKCKESIADEMSICFRNRFKSLVPSDVANHLGVEQWDPGEETTIVTIGTKGFECNNEIVLDAQGRNFLLFIIKKSRVMVGR